MEQWQEVILTTASTLAIALISYGITIFSNWIKSKTDSEKYDTYISLATNSVIQAVTYVSQTYVDALKESGKFDKDAQTEAFIKAKEKVMSLLSDETKRCLTKYLGNLDSWIITKIEQTVRDLK